MAAGFSVDRSQLDARAGETARNLLSALADVDKIKRWLDDHPGYDPASYLVESFGYSSEDAYLLHSVFSDLSAIRLSHSDALDRARKLTGLA